MTAIAVFGRSVDGDGVRESEERRSINAFSETSWKGCQAVWSRLGSSLLSSSS